MQPTTTSAQGKINGILKPWRAFTRPGVKRFFSSAIVAASLLFVEDVNANKIEVDFAATIDDSPFSTSGYTVGSSLDGVFIYDVDAVPSDAGVSYARYPTQELVFFLENFGGAIYAVPARLDLVHENPSITPNAVDYLDVFGFNLLGPTVEDFRPDFAELKLTDTDNNVYANTPLFPIGTPDPAAFEKKELRYVLRNNFSSPQTSATIHARIDRVTVTAIQVPEGGSTFWMLGGSVGLLGLARRHFARP